jgi:hypothetical protein
MEIVWIRIRDEKVVGSGSWIRDKKSRVRNPGLKDSITEIVSRDFAQMLAI